MKIRTLHHRWYTVDGFILPVAGRLDTATRGGGIYVDALVPAKRTTIFYICPVTEHDGLIGKPEISFSTVFVFDALFLRGASSLTDYSLC